MEIQPQIICIVGPESSGKTTLALQLAKHFNVPMVPEYAREFLLRSGGNYSEADLIEVAKGQMELESRISERCDKMLVCDTDLLVIKIWQEFKFERPNEELDELLAKQNHRKYLLTYPDIPWEADSLRENPHDLIEIFEAYQSALTKCNLDFKVVQGKGSARFQAAIQLIGAGKLR